MSLQEAAANAEMNRKRAERAEQERLAREERRQRQQAQVRLILVRHTSVTLRMSNLDFDMLLSLCSRRLVFAYSDTASATATIFPHTLI